MISSDRALDWLADQLAARLATRGVAAPEWMNSKAAARYLSITTKALYHLRDRRGLPAYQDEPGGKLYFKRSELDAWRMK